MSTHVRSSICFRDDFLYDYLLYRYLKKTCDLKSISNLLTEIVPRASFNEKGMIVEDLGEPVSLQSRQGIYCWHSTAYLKIKVRFKPKVTSSALYSYAWPRGYKTLFILNAAEYEIYPDHKC